VILSALLIGLPDRNDLLLLTLLVARPGDKKREQRTEYCHAGRYVACGSKVLYDLLLLFPFRPAGETETTTNGIWDVWYSTRVPTPNP